MTGSSSGSENKSSDLQALKKGQWVIWLVALWLAYAFVVMPLISASREFASAIVIIGTFGVALGASLAYLRRTPQEISVSIVIAGVACFASWLLAEKVWDGVDYTRAKKSTEEACRFKDSLERVDGPTRPPETGVVKIIICQDIGGLSSLWESLPRERRAHTLDEATLTVWINTEMIEEATLNDNTVSHNRIPVYRQDWNVSLFNRVTAQAISVRTFRGSSAPKAWSNPESSVSIPLAWKGSGMKLKYDDDYTIVMGPSKERPIAHLIGPPPDSSAVLDHIVSFKSK